MSEVEVQSSLVKGPGGLYTLKDGTITSIADIQPQLLDFLYNIKNERLSDDLKQIERHTGIYREQVSCLFYRSISVLQFYLSTPVRRRRKIKMQNSRAKFLSVNQFSTSHAKVY